MLAGIADLQLVGMRVTLGMPVEELTEQRSSRSLDLGDEHQRLPDLDEMLQPAARERLVLLALAQPLPRTCLPVSFPPPPKRQGH